MPSTSKPGNCTNARRDTNGASAVRPVQCLIAHCFWCSGHCVFALRMGPNCTRAAADTVLCTPAKRLKTNQVRILETFSKPPPSATRPSLRRQNQSACGTLLHVARTFAVKAQSVWDRWASIENKGRTIDTERFSSFAITQRLRRMVNQRTTGGLQRHLFRAFNARIAYTRMCTLKRSLNLGRLNVLRSRVGSL